MCVRTDLIEKRFNMKIEELKENIEKLNFKDNENDNFNTLLRIIEISNELLERYV